MKRIEKVVISVAAVLLCVILGYSVWWFQEQKTEPKVVKIGITVYKETDTFIASIITELEEVIKEQEQENGITIKLDISDGKENQAEQNEQVERYISLGYDAICVNLVDRTNAAILIDKAADAGIPMVFFNREPVEEDLFRADDIYYIGSDAKESAITQGKIILDVYAEDSKFIDKNQNGTVEYAMIEGEAGHQDTIIRTDYSVKTLEEGGMNLQKVAGFVANFDRSQSAAMIEQWLTSNPNEEIELIISNNDDMALGAADALEKLGKEECSIVGIDGIPSGIEAVKNGKMMGTVVSDARVYAENIFAVAYASSNGWPIPETVKVENQRYIWIPWRTETGKRE